MATNTTVVWIYFVMVSACLIHQAFGQIEYQQNTPPVMHMERHWVIPEDEKVDTKITLVQAHDNEDDVLTFELEQVGPDDPDKPKERLPFRIDPNGYVYLNESLLGRGNEQFLLYVAVADGKVTSKTQVLVDIISKNPSKNPPRQTYTPNADSVMLPYFNIFSGGRPPLPPPLNFYPQYETNTYVKNDTSYADGDDNKSETSHEINDNKNNKTTVVVAVDSNNNNNNTTQQEHANNNQHPTNLKDDHSVKVLPILFIVGGIFFERTCVPLENP